MGRRIEQEHISGDYLPPRERWIMGSRSRCRHNLVLVEVVRILQLRVNMESECGPFGCHWRSNSLKNKGNRPQPSFVSSCLPVSFTHFCSPVFTILSAAQIVRSTGALYASGAEVDWTPGPCSFPTLLDKVEGLKNVWWVLLRVLTWLKA